MEYNIFECHVRMSVKILVVDDGCCLIYNNEYLWLLFVYDVYNK